MTAFGITAQCYLKKRIQKCQSHTLTLRYRALKNENSNVPSQTCDKMKNATFKHYFKIHKNEKAFFSSTPLCAHKNTKSGLK